jgi:hypothetical protein
MQEHKDILLYFISTVPQTVGAMLAVLGAYQLNLNISIKHKLLGQSQSLYNKIKDGENSRIVNKFKGTGTQGDLNALKEYSDTLQINQITNDYRWINRIATKVHDLIVEKGLEQDKGDLSILIQITNKIKRNYEFLRQQKKKFKKLLIANGFIIAFFLIEFVFIPFYIINKITYYSSIIIKVALSVFALRSIILFILSSIKRDNL